MENLAKKVAEIPKEERKEILELVKETHRVLTNMNGLGVVKGGEGDRCA